MRARDRTCQCLVCCPSNTPTHNAGVGEQSKINYDWCFDCEQRCENVIEAIETRNLGSDDITNKKLDAIAEGIFPFFRGTDHLYLEDVLRWPSNSSFHAFGVFDGSLTFVDADQHLSNFGSFHDGIKHLVFDMNDFDEVMIGSYIIDLWRTGVSILIQSEENGLSQEDQQEILRSFAYTYFSTVIGYVENDNELYFELGVQNTYGEVHTLLEKVEKERSRKWMLDKYAPINKANNGTRKFKRKKSMVQVTEKEYNDLKAAWPSYIESCPKFHRSGFENPFDTITDKSKYFKIKDMVRKVGAGLGSLGSDRFSVLIEGPTDSQDDDIYLDVKEEPKPSWLDFANKKLLLMNAFADNGQRIAMGYKALKTNVPPTLGYLNINNATFVVRPRSPYKASVNYSALTDLESFRQVADQLAKVSATGHSRADNDYRPDIIPWSFEDSFAKAAAHGEGPFISSVIEFSFMYFSQLKADWKCWADHRNTASKPTE